MSFYEGLFGWEFENVATADAPDPYFIGRLRGKDVAAVAPQPDGAPRAAMWNSYVWVDSADETVAKAKEAGGRVLAEPFDVGDAGRMALLADPSGAVFGWETKSVDFGSGDFTWFSLPGYGAYLLEHDPELRDRLEEDSAPEGFEDAVAWFVPVDDYDTPLHWSITFAVDDADATADRATELGGEVIARSFDAPYVRMTVIRDPQGAVFTASKYMPPG